MQTSWWNGNPKRSTARYFFHDSFYHRNEALLEVLSIDAITERDRSNFDQEGKCFNTLNNSIHAQFEFGVEFKLTETETIFS